jgi:hypothetical protein
MTDLVGRVAMDEADVGCSSPWLSLRGDSLAWMPMPVIAGLVFDSQTILAVGEISAGWKGDVLLFD